MSTKIRRMYIKVIKWIRSDHTFIDICLCDRSLATCFFIEFILHLKHANKAISVYIAVVYSDRILTHDIINKLSKQQQLAQHPIIMYIQSCNHSSEINCRFSASEEFCSALLAVVGCSITPASAATVGDLDGLLDGAFDGVCVGSSVSLSANGLGDGLSVGLDVGDVVGLDVGDVVGV